MKFLLFLTCYCLFFFLGAQNNAFKQSEIDTMCIKRSNKIHLKKLKHTLENDSTLRGWVKYYVLRTYIKQHARENDSALIYAKKAIKEYHNKEKNYFAADAIIHKSYYVLGLRQYFNGKILESLKNLNIALDFSTKYSQVPCGFSSKFNILSRISLIHQSRGDFELALKACKEAIKDDRNMSFKFESGNMYRSIGHISKQIKQNDSAKHYFHKSLKRYDDSTLIRYSNYEKTSMIINRSDGNLALGDIYRDEELLDSAIIYYKKAYNLMKKNNLLNVVMKNNIVRLNVKASYGYVFFNEGLIDKSISILKNVHDSLNNMSKYYDKVELDLRLKTHRLLSEVYASINKEDEALRITQELTDYILQYHEESIVKQLQLYSVEFDVEQKDNSILQLERNKTQQKTIIKQQKTITYSLCILFFVLVFFGLFYWRQHKLRVRFEKESLEQRLLLSQMNPHFIGNTMNTICLLVENKSDHTIFYINKLSNLFRLILNNSREEFISLDEEVINIKTYLELQSNFSQSFDFSFSIDKNIDSNVLIPPMLIQPFVENAIIHGVHLNENRGSIIVDVISRKKEKLLLLRVSDNGKGDFTTSVDGLKINHKSISSEIVKKRLAILKKKFKVNARLEMKSIKTGGVKVKIYVPYLIDS